MPTNDFQNKKCVPCEGGVPKLSRSDAENSLSEIADWVLDSEGRTISRDFRFKNFVQAVAFLNQIAEIAESEQHHPDLHLTAYRNLKIVLTTHAIAGLSENDLILAAKINHLKSVSSN